MPLRSPTLKWGLLPTFLLCVAVLPAAAQPKKKDKEPVAAPAPTEKAAPAEKKKEGKVQKFDFTGIDLNGRMRTPQLLYFLERANEELERASLEKRSFIPHMVRSVEEEQL
jgi:hypothetical protein